MGSLGPLGLLVEACETCDDSYSENDEVGEETGIEEEQDLNSNILYCKARRMPLDHVKESAILLFKKGEEGVHGAELLCSHPVCREKGVKFRYCAPCQKAVAKRNFRKRHAHCDSLEICNSNKRKLLQPTCQIIPSRQYETITTTNREENIQSNAFGKHELGYAIDETCRSNFHLTNSGDQPRDTNTFNYEYLRTSMMHVPEPWINLFHERPRDGDKEKIKIWLVRAMNIAEISTNATHFTSSNILSTNTSNDPVTAVREEFTGMVPPRYVTLGQDFGHNITNLKDYTDVTPLHIKTEHDEAEQSSILLDSKGSIII